MKTIKLDGESVGKLRLMQNKKAKKKIDIPFIRTAEGKIKVNSLRNIELIIENDERLKGRFRFNLFTSEIDVVKDSKELNIKQGRLMDAYYSEIASYIESNADYNHVLFDERKIRSALTVVSRRHSYNPIIDYMNEAYKEWDKEERLNTLLADYLGVEQTPTVELITKLFFCGAVAKAFNPKTKFDFVLDLVGGQGAGKTTFLQNIAPLGYYTDQFTNFDNKDDFAVMRRALIINDDELTATSNASFEILKKFITLQEFEYRKPYGHEAERFAKNFVMARTTNELYYLKDKTGERRFLPVLVSKSRQKKSPIDDLDEEFVKQLWGEAVHLYKDEKFTFKLTKQQEQELENHRINFMYTDEVEDRIDEMLANDFEGKDFITSKDIALRLGDNVDLTKDRKLASKVSEIMINRFHFRKSRKRIEGTMKRGYERSV
ncbi:VapE domain-containing protein [Ligilactobacillus aviarius]|uniref:VapE domain-containing protein n=1 Tax=Ligilactobacillus aviarius TaxID=1606 RepID=UPI0024304E0A|nr:VapE domain-containing protein [Ligilactobacillus aviarius]